MESSSGPLNVNYRVQLTFSGPELDSIGLLVDFVAVKKLMQTVDRKSVV